MDLFELGYETGWNASGEGCNGEYCRPRVPWPEFWAGQIAAAREEQWPALLAHNLAIAAGLCRAFEEGAFQGIAGLFDEIEQMKTPATRRRPAWVPGCGRSAP